VFFRSADWIALVGAFFGLAGLVGVGELFRRWGWDAAATRRLVHAGVGLFIVGMPLLFSAPGPVYVLATAFVVINGGSKWRDWWPGMHAARPESWRTVVMPLALIPALAATWTVNPDRLFVLQIAFLILSLADPLASWVGQKGGRHTLIGTATVEGSSAFLGVAVLLTGGVLLSRTGWGIGRTATVALIVAVVATAIEAISRHGWDNFFVVVGVVLVLVSLYETPGAIWTVGWALGIGAGFGAAAYVGRALDAAGAVGGGLFAASLLGLGGWAWALPGFVFFVLSSMLSHLTGDTVSPDMKDEKGRTLRQVLANGGVAWGLLVMFAVAPPGDESLEAACYAGFLGALAAAAADTWATEIGVRSSRRPWSLRTWSRVEAGRSGAVSAVGTVGAALGAASVAGAAVLTGGVFGFGSWTAVWIVAAGLAGMITDSVAGATIQARYRDPGTGRLVEDATESPARPTHGWALIDNEVVNVLGTTTGALTAILLAG